MSRLDAHTPLAPPPPSLALPLLIVLAYLALVAAGMALLRTPQAMPAGSELSVPRTVFTACNAASLTGFQQTVEVQSYKPLGQAVVLGMILAGSLASMLVGAAAVVRLLRLPYSMRHIAIWAAAVHTIGIGIGTAVLLGTGRTWFASLFHSASALGNCGVVIGQTASMYDPSFHLLILPLALIGGVGLPVLMELCDWMRLVRAPSRHTRVVLGMSGGVYVAGFALLLMLSPRGDAVAESEAVGGLGDSLVAASAHSLNARSLGWPIDSPANWPRAATWIVMLLMLIGASPAGTGGGVKTTTVYALTSGTWHTLRGRAAGRIFGIAVVWFFGFCLLVLLATMYLVSTQPQLPADQALFIATSAAANVGLSYAPIAITGQGLFGLSLIMLLGRLLPLAVLWWAALTVTDADVAVG